MRRLPPSSGESRRRERPTANHQRVGGVTESQGGQADHGADHPGIVAPGLEQALAHRRHRAAGHEGAAQADQPKKAAQKFNREHCFNMPQVVDVRKG